MKAGTGRTDLSGQVAIVTGGARAIGREIAEKLASRGATVEIFDLAPAAQTVEVIRAEGGRAESQLLDVTDEEGVKDAVRQVVDRNGRVDILINNAGLFAGIARRPFWEIDMAEWRRVMEVNVDSIFLLCREVLEPMKASGGGRVVNLSSNVITFGMADLMHYVASKGAVSVMTRSLAREMGPFGIAVNAVGPGLVTTEVTTAEISETYLRLVAEGQMLTQPIFPADIADAVAFLASPAGRMITGQTLFVNGGATAGGV
ncbi:MAG: SDR family oxidoreductase [bacterium]|nr:SDR family oxidoreductase [bacterium]